MSNEEKKPSDWSSRKQRTSELLKECNEILNNPDTYIGYGQVFIDFLIHDKLQAKEDDIAELRATVTDLQAEINRLSKSNDMLRSEADRKIIAASGSQEPGIPRDS